MHIKFNMKTISVKIRKDTSSVVIPSPKDRATPSATLETTPPQITFQNAVRCIAKRGISHGKRRHFATQNAAFCKVLSMKKKNRRSSE